MPICFNIRLTLRLSSPLNILSSISLCTCLSLSAVAPQAQEELQLTLRPDSLFQTLDNFASSAAFELNEITEAWDEDNLDTLAKMLFSTDIRPDGSLVGIGLSGFRLEIGTGSFDQGSASKISRVTARSRTPLRADGSYDWSQMEAEMYWAKQAHAYGLKTLIGYSNSPPVYFTRNGLACRSDGSPISNLRPDAYSDFAEYLARVAEHFDDLGTPLHYISPVNEPQWEWICDTQEGTQWTSQEIRDVVVAMQPAFTALSLKTRALITEAGSIDWIYNQWDGNALTGQLRYWTPGSPLYIGNLSVLAPQISGHSYWTEDNDDRLFTIRRDLAAGVKAASPSLTWWQSEYSFLGTGYQDLSASPTAHELGLFLGKVIHADLTIGQAAAWQFWETFESTSGLPRYRLVRVDRNRQTATREKTYWALGHYSRFIRPGMRRMAVGRSDGLTARTSLRDIMPTAFINQATGDYTLVLVNYLTSEKNITVSVPGVPESISVTPYLSTPTLDMVRQEPFTLGSSWTLPARSIATLTFRHAESAANSPKEKFTSRHYNWQKLHFTLQPSAGAYRLLRTGESLNGGEWIESEFQSTSVQVLDIKGQVVAHFKIPAPGSSVVLPLQRGIYSWRLANNPIGGLLIAE
jgi:O-glycosyl hydrolase